MAVSVPLSEAQIGKDWEPANKAMLFPTHLKQTVSFSFAFTFRLYSSKSLSAVNCCVRLATSMLRVAVYHWVINP
jgi:hypothetical protein